MINKSARTTAAPFPALATQLSLQEAGPRREILIVDDVPEILDFFKGLSRRLNGLSVHVTTENNSARALDAVKAQKFDVIVSDYRMRQVDGVEVLQAAREHHPAGHRILMTGYNEIPTSLDRIRAAGVDAYIQKPLKSHDLLLLLLDFLHGNEAAIAACRGHARELEAIASREEQAFGLA